MLKAQEEGISTREDELSFVVEKDEDEPVVYGEFSDFEEGTTSPSELGGDNVTFGSSTYNIVTTEDGTKYVTSTGSQSVKGGSISITLPRAVSKGEIAFDLSFKAIGGNIKRNLFTARDSSNNKVYMLQINQNNTISKNNETITVGGSSTGNTYTTDQDGFYNIRVVYRADDELSNWTINVYDKLTSTTEPIWKAELGRVYDSEKGKYGLPDIAQLALFDIWWVNGNDAGGAGIAVKEYAYHILPVPEVMSSNLQAAEPDIEDIELFVDSDLNEAILSQETVILTDGERTIPANVSYNTSDRKLTITPKEYLKYNTQYDIKFGNLICENVSFTTAPRQISMSTDAALVDTNGVKSVQISARNNTASSANVYVIAKVFDAQGNLIKTIGDDSFTIAANQSLNNAKLPLTDVVLEAGYKVKTFIWASQNGLIYPISSPFEITN